jgi:hypothetical protein
LSTIESFAAGTNRRVIRNPFPTAGELPACSGEAALQRLFFASCTTAKNAGFGLPSRSKSKG